LPHGSTPKPPKSNSNVTGLVMPRMVRSPSTRKSPASTRAPVERNSIVGWFSTSKKSAERRWLSRPSSLVSTEATSTLATTVASSGFSGATSVALFMPKVPRTFEIIM
jgi:hypothetical protein